MKIKTVHYLATINLGNYSNEKVGFTAELQDGESAEQVLDALRQKARICALPNSEEVYNQISRSQSELRKLERKLASAREEWNKTAEFLKVQGIKPDAAPMPQFTNLLPQVTEEHSEVVDGEIDSSDPIF